MTPEGIFHKVRPYTNQVPREMISFLRDLMKFGPTNFLEIGTDRGGTFRAWGLACRPGGVKISVDIPRPGFWNGFDFEKLHCEMPSWFPGVHLVHASSHDPSTLARVKQILDGTMLDFLFIDGDHSYEGVRSDFEMFSPLVRGGGLIAFHDIVDSERQRRQDCFVARFWNELQGEKHAYIFDGSWGGIGVLRRP